MTRAINLMYKVAARARELADKPMATLRKVEAEPSSYDGDGAHDSRGKIIETLIATEFEDDFARLDRLIDE